MKRRSNILGVRGAKCLSVIGITVNIMDKFVYNPNRWQSQQLLMHDIAEDVNPNGRITILLEIKFPVKCLKTILSACLISVLVQHFVKVNVAKF